MDRFITDKERNLIQELVAIAQKLPEDEQEHLIWLGEGILFATSQNNG